MGASNAKPLLQVCAETLESSNVSYDDDDFWGLFFKPQSMDEVFQSAQFSRLVAVCCARPANVAMLVHKLVDRVAAAAESTEQDTNVEVFAEAEQAVRWLSRVVPAVLSASRLHGIDLADRLFWSVRLDTATLAVIAAAPAANAAAAAPAAAAAAAGTGVGVGVGVDGAGSDGAAGTGVAEAASSGEEGASASTCAAEGAVLYLERQNENTLARLVLHSISRLMFHAGYSCYPPSSKGSSAETASIVPSELCWATGVGVDAVTGCAARHMQRRTELLQCLLGCFSETLYNTPEVAQARRDAWLDLFTSSAELCPPALIHSLINVTCNYDPIGWGLPYNHVMFSDYAAPLADVASQVLCIALDHHRSEGVNVSMSYAAAISRPEDFKFIFDSLQRLLSNPFQAENVYLPYSTKRIESHQEMLMFFWKLINANPAFLAYVLKHEDVNTVIVPVIYFILDGRKDDAQLGLVHLCTFLLLVLSGEREFAIQLNKPFVPLSRRSSSELPMIGNGNVADFLIVVFHKTLTDSSAKLHGLHECLLTIIANLSPYIKALSMVATVALLRLFERYTKPKFLFAEERNHRFVIFLLETFNNLIQYQYEGNARLVYAMLRRRNTFQQLAKLRFPSADPQPEAAASDESATSSDASAAAAAPPSADGEGAAPRGTGGLPERKDVDASAVTVAAEKAVPAHAPAAFVPTEEWFEAWKVQLPLSTSLRLIAAVLPSLPSIIRGSAEDEAQILEYLSNTTLVGLLPVPHPILIRRYQENDATSLWFHRYMWGVVFVRNRTPPLFGGPKHIKLFAIQ